MSNPVDIARDRAAELYRRARAHRYAGRESLAQSIERSADREIARALAAIEQARVQIERIALDAQAQALADFNRIHAGRAA